MKKPLIKQDRKQTSNSKRDSFRILSSLFLLLIVISAFFSFNFLNVSMNQKKVGSDFYHVLINGPQGHTDRGFNQGALEGVCEAYGVEASDCTETNAEVENFLSFSYPGTVAHSGLIYKHLLNKFYAQKKKNYILPGFTYSDFLFRYAREMEALGINLITIDTYFGVPKGQT